MLRCFHDAESIQKFSNLDWRQYRSWAVCVQEDQRCRGYKALEQVRRSIFRIRQERTFGRRAPQNSSGEARQESLNQVFYDAAPDPYCYPGSTVLKNRLGLRVQAELDAFEHELTAQRFDEPLPIGHLGVAHYRAIHRGAFPFRSQSDSSLSRGQWADAAGVLRRFGATRWTSPEPGGPRSRCLPCGHGEKLPWRGSRFGQGDCQPCHAPAKMTPKALR